MSSRLRTNVAKSDFEIFDLSCCFSFSSKYKERLNKFVNNNMQSLRLSLTFESSIQARQEKNLLSILQLRNRYFDQFKQKIF